MSNFSDLSLVVEDVTNAAKLLADKTRSVRALIKYWNAFNVNLLNNILCNNLNDNIYAGLLYQMDLIRMQVKLIEKMHDDIVVVLTPIELSSLPFQNLVDLIQQFKSGILRMIVGNLYQVFDEYAPAHNHLNFPRPTEAEIRDGYLPPNDDDDDDDAVIAVVF